MNILYLCDEYPPCQHGGIGSVTQLLARTLVTKGHKVYVAGFYPYFRVAAIEEEDKGVKIYRFFYGSKILFQFSKRKILGNFFNIDHQFNKYINFLRKLIIEKKIDIIESPDFLEAFRYSGPRIIRFPDFGVPMVVKLHSSFTVYNSQNNKKNRHKKIFLKEQFLLNSADGIIGVSDNIRQRVKSIFKSINKIDVLYNGIVINQVAKYNTKVNSNTVVFSGSLVRNKGIFSLLTAWARVLEIIPFARLLVFGKTDDSSVKKLNSCINDLPKNSVDLKGFVTRDLLTEIYASVACAVFPSYQEAFSMAPMEAMAVGCPVIHTKRTSGPELINDGVEGLLVDPDNIQELVDAIIMMLTNRKRAVEMGQNGYQKIRNQFDISIIADKHIKYYMNILG